MALQILAWMASGLYFSLIPIAEIRGEHLTKPAESPAPAQLESMVTPTVVAGLIRRDIGDGWTLSRMELISVEGQGYWRVEGKHAGHVFTRLVNADGSGFVPRLSEEEAQARAVQWLREPAEPRSAEWVEQLAAGSEFRGRALPVWKVTFLEPEAVSLYLHPWTGELLARRTDRWRIFDFLWMLHIMDFSERDDFNHPLLQVAAALGLLIVLSGVAYWVMSTRLFRRRVRRITDYPL